MKRLPSFLIIPLFISLTSISFASEKPILVATASMISDMASNIVGDKMDVVCIVPVGGDPHIYEPTPRSAQMVSVADLVLKNGLTFEGWLNELIDNSGTKAQVVEVTKGIKPISSLTYENAPDPHAWMDISLGQEYIKNIKEAVISIDPENKGFYAQQYERYKKELEEMDQYIKQQINEIPAQQRILITSHDAFQYYGRRYGLQLESVMGVSTDADVQTSDIENLQKVIKTKNVPAVFIESTINPKLLQQLAADNNVKVGGQLYADSIGKLGSSADSYLKMLKHNTDVIVSALTRNTPSSNSMPNNNRTYYIVGGVVLLAVLGFLFFMRQD